MNVEHYKKWDQDYVWHPYTTFSALENTPLPIISQGKGIYLYDINGTPYVDAIASWWACNLGHSHPRIVNAIKKQCDELQHSILGNLSHPPAIELAKELAHKMPDSDCHVHFASDGASAVETALKISLQYWYNLGMSKKIKFLSLKEAYHGDTLAAVSMGYQETFHRPFKEMLLRSDQLPVSPYDATEEEALCQAEDVIKQHRDEYAAMLVEPLCQGAAGMRIYSANYLHKLYELCKKHDILFIADEIATGMGRTGKMFAFEHANIIPDMVCVGKGLSAGYLPISAAIVRNQIHETFSDQPTDHTFYHGHTFAGNPLAAATAIETLRTYADDHIIENAHKLGIKLEIFLRPLAIHPSIKEVRCLGMIGAIEFKKEITGKAQRVQKYMKNHGYLVRPLGQVIYVMLPLITPEKALEATVRTLARAVEETSNATINTCKHRAELFDDL